MPYRRRYYELKKYGLTPKEYHDRLDSIKGCCEVCGDSLVNPDSKQNFHIDHDHDTGEVRGFLCTHCNRLLGSAKYNVLTLQGAIRYLEKSLRDKVDCCTVCGDLIGSCFCSKEKCS